MTTFSQTTAGVAIAGVFTLVAVFGAAGNNPLLANVALATYGGGDAVTICDTNGTTTVVAADVAARLAAGAQLGACSDDAGALTIAKVHLQSTGATQDWVELYNPSNQTVSLAGWQICNAQSCDSLGSASVAPGEYVLVAENPSIHTEISIPWGVELVIVGDGTIGGGLANDADIIKLRGSDNIIVDQMNWGVADTAWANYNESTWSGLSGVTDAVLTRADISIDTNTASDWTAAGVPTVDLTNTFTTEVPAAGTFDITWSAVNPNGADSDLRIDLYWFEADDTLHLIELGTANDGSYTWTTPAEYTGEARIKIVATAPSNPLLNARDVATFTAAAANTGSGTGTSTTPGGPTGGGFGSN